MFLFKVIKLNYLLSVHRHLLRLFFKIKISTRSTKITKYRMLLPSAAKVVVSLSASSTLYPSKCGEPLTLILIIIYQTNMVKRNAQKQMTHLYGIHGCDGVGV